MGSVDLKVSVDLKASVELKGSVDLKGMAPRFPGMAPHRLFLVFFVYFFYFGVDSFKKKRLRAFGAR